MEKWFYNLVSLAIVCPFFFTSEVEFEWSALDFVYFHWNTQEDARFLSLASDMVPFAFSLLAISNSNFINYDHFTEL